ncbi:MAG: 50S ribosomal protein L9 [Candidatus Vogelbacteria bacterium]|nr:50S ribosomal protein L9 [Candidatus Vogelbacteria bacterium]
MKIVLLDDVAKVGKRFEIKNVASGYARNFLIPKGSAALANPAILKRVELMKHKYEVELNKRRAEASQVINQLADSIIVIEAKANEQGHLFEGLDRAAIAAAVKRETKLDLNPEWLQLERPLKAIGDYDLAIAQGDSQSRIKVRVQTLL